MASDPALVEQVADKSLVRASFGRAARGYDEWAVMQRRIGDRLLGCLSAAPLPHRPKILDLGSGTGYCTRQLQQRQASVTGLDIAPQMLVTARSRQLVDTAYVCADAEYLPVADDSIDLVFSNLMIQWCRDLQRLFGEVARVLQPGGLLVFSTFGPETLSELRAAWRQVDMHSHVNHFAAESEIKKAMLRAGLINESLECEATRVTYGGVLELMRELKGIGAHNVTRDRPRTLTGKEKIRRVIDGYPSRQVEGEITATFELILGKCSRPAADRERIEWRG
jgi:malonyl-CoA O-methyltransferase